MSDSSTYQPDRIHRVSALRRSGGRYEFEITERRLFEAIAEFPRRGGIVFDRLDGGVVHIPGGDYAGFESVVAAQIEATAIYRPEPGVIQLDKAGIAALQPGDWVRHRRSGDRYTVSSNEGGEVVGVLEMSVSNPAEWELVNCLKPDPADPAYVAQVCAVEPTDAAEIMQHLEPTAGTPVPVQPVERPDPLFRSHADCTDPHCDACNPLARSASYRR